MDTDVGQIDETGSATTVGAGPEFVDPLRKDDEVTAAPGTVLTTVTATTGHSTAVTTTPAVVVKNDSVKAESNEGEMTFMMILNKTMTQMRVSSNQVSQTCFFYKKK